jgi:transcriptional regulator with XRE-family HTH domain
MPAAPMMSCTDGLSMPPCTIISDFDASEKIRGSANAPITELQYIPDMVEGAPNNLRAWRKTKRSGYEPMTQQELADALGTAKSVISDLERGVVQLSDKWLRRLAPVLKTQPGHILDHDPADLDNDIIDIWAHIPDRDKEQAARVLRSFVRRTGTDD